MLERLREDISVGKKVGIIHLSDACFRSDTTWYKGAAFVLKFYYCSFISHPAIKYLPLGCPEHVTPRETIRPASNRSLMWSFCAQPAQPFLALRVPPLGVAPERLTRAGGADFPAPR